MAAATVAAAISPVVALALAPAAAALVTTAGGTVFVEPTGHVLGAVLATTIVEHDLVALAQAVAVLDAGEVAEHIVASVIRLDKAEASVVPSSGNATGQAATTATAATATAAPSAARARARAAAAAAGAAATATAAAAAGAALSAAAAAATAALGAGAATSGVRHVRFSVNIKL